jgi:superfamily I DNA/RNA helicase
MPRELVELGALVLLVPPRLDPVDARLLAAIARWARLHTGFAEFDDSDELANALGTQGSFELESALDALGIRHQSSRVAAQLAGPEIGVIRAPDPAEEVREVVRSIARDMDGPAPVPLHQIAVLYRQTDPYGPLVRDSLSQAGLPWSALEGRTLAESRPGRALLQLLNVRERDFAREAVLGWIDAAPGPRAGLPGSAWDRLSRSANVVRRSSQWSARLANYSARQREIAEQRDAEQNPTAASALHQVADQADRMRTSIEALEQSLHPPRTSHPGATLWIGRTDCGPPTAAESARGRSRSGLLRRTLPAPCRHCVKPTSWRLAPVHRSSCS